MSNWSFLHQVPQEGGRFPESDIRLMNDFTEYE